MLGLPRLVHPRNAQKIASAVLYAFTAFTVIILVYIVYFVLRRGIGELTWSFLTTRPRGGGGGGISSTIIATLYLTALGVFIATPLGLGAAIYLAEYTREGTLTKIIRFGAECLAGVPSIIFGLFGFAFFNTYLGFRYSLISGGLTLAIMILPTIIRTSEEALRAVPRSHREVALSLGASKWQSIVRVVLPSAMPGILTGVILSVGRSVSETAALLFTSGIALNTPTSLFQSARTMSIHFYLLVTEGETSALPKAYGTAAVLVLTILTINIAAYALMNRFMRKFR